jgi:Holliday junction resolvase-like predicted endonuclease
VALAPDGVLVGIEVRSRRSRRAGRAAETVDARRMRRLRAALARYCAEQAPPPHRATRIDVITVERPTSPPAASRMWRLTRTPLIGW